MKNIIVFNNRSLHLYDFKELKERHNIRIAAVLFDTAYKYLSESVKTSLDEIYVVPTPKSKQKYMPLPEPLLYPFIEKQLHQFQDTWVVSVDELNVLVAAHLREKYHLIGTPSAVVLNYRNKTQQKEILTKAGLKTPKFVPILKNLANDREIKIVYENLVSTLKAPFILKPIDMGGSVGVEKIQTYNQFCHYFKKFANFSEFIAEEFIDGQLYHCDFIIQDNKYIFAEVSEYLFNGLSFLNGYNHGSLLLNIDNPLRSPIIDFCKKANASLGLRSGCAHFEVFVTKEEEIVFVEAAGRPAGSMVPLVYSKTFKNNFLNAALLAEAQENPGNFKAPIEYYFWTVFPKQPRIVKSLTAPALQSPYDLEWSARIGEALTAPLSVSDNAGFLIAKNDNYENLKSDFCYIRKFEAIEFDDSRDLQNYPL